MKKLRFMTVLLVFALALCISAAAYSDVPESAWYAGYVNTLSELGVINGYPDGSFCAGETVTTGQFIKMLAVIAELVPVTNAGTHWASPNWCALYDANCLTGVDIPNTAQALDRAVTRYEMAQLSYNVLLRALGEIDDRVSSPETAITDYASIPEIYCSAVTQVYAKGVITGYGDGSFMGERTLTRAEAATVIYRIGFAGERKPAEFEMESEDFVSFAQQYASMTQEERNIALFGSADKSYFTAGDDVSEYIVSVSVPIWRLNTQTGVKTASSMTLRVHKLVAEEVVRIFTEIFNDPEQFPISDAGGFRTGDTMRHAWGCAIDINYDKNCYGYYDSEGNLVPSVGSGWFPEEDPFSITPGGSVVRIFAKYGWGWGGQGYSSGWHDFMHFSILPSGG